MPETTTSTALTLVLFAGGPPGEPNWVRSVRSPELLPVPVWTKGKLAAMFVTRFCASELASGVVYPLVLVKLGTVVPPVKPEIPKLPKVSSVARQPPVESVENPLLSRLRLLSDFSVPAVVGQLLVTPNISDGARNAKAATTAGKPNLGLSTPILMFRTLFFFDMPGPQVGARASSAYLINLSSPVKQVKCNEPVLARS